MDFPTSAFALLLVAFTTLATLTPVSDLRAQGALAETRTAAAGASAGRVRTEKIDAYLDALERVPSLPAKDALQAAWAGYLLAETTSQRARVLAFTAQIPEAAARMLIGSFREFPELRKEYATAERAHAARITRESPDTTLRTHPRDLYGLNAFDAPYTADHWTDPWGFVGRWRGDGISVDIVAFPADNFLGLLRRDDSHEDATIRLLGEREGNRLHLVGPKISALLDSGRLHLTLEDSTLTLVRTPVGVTQFDQRPAQAHVLLDSTTGLKHFRHSKAEAGWTLHPNGSIEIIPSKGSLFTQETFRDLQGYLEFRHAYNSESLGPRRGNSGLYLYNTYEVQLVDSFGLAPQETSAGSVYHIAAPSVNAAAPPLEWQSLRFDFRAPRFDASGNKTASARLTLWLNGVKVHDDLEIPHPTAGSAAGGRALKEPSSPQPLMLQSHGNLLQFRNMWVLPREESP